MLKFNIIIQQYVNFEALSCLSLRFLVIIHTSPHDSCCHIILSQYNGKTRTYFHKRNTYVRKTCMHLLFLLPLFHTYFSY
ncbi:hypothetical protein H8957_008771, partial [Semnopithecus entellus]